MSTDQPSSPSLTRYQTFRAVNVHRSQLVNAPYNPRQMDRYAKKKLREELKKNGLVDPPVWNKTTGNIVGGNHRVESLDALEGSADYYLTVAMIEVPLAKEKAINIALNNQAIQGVFDPDMLASLLAEISQENEMAATGFERADLAFLLDQGMCDSIFGRQETFEQPILTEMEAINQAGREAEQAKQDNGEGKGNSSTTSPSASAPSPDFSGSPNSLDSTFADFPAPIDPNSREALMARRTDYLKGTVDANQSEFMLVAVFDSDEQVTAFLQAVGMPPDSRYISGGELASKIGIEL